MTALLDHADSDGLLRDSGAGDSQTMYSNGLLYAFRRTHVFRRARGDVRRYVECSSGVQGGVAYGLACGAPLSWRSRCVEVTQRAVLSAEEESQRETASDTP